MRVFTAPGTRTDAPSEVLAAARSCARHSVRPSAANFDVVYGPLYALLTTPASDDVLTMWPGSPPAIIRGTKDLMPWMIPHTLTPSTHSQSAAVRFQSTPAWKTPALLHSRCTAANVSFVRAASAFDCVAVTDVGDDAY